MNRGLLDYYTKRIAEEIKEDLANSDSGGGSGKGVNIVSAHDDLSAIIPADGEQYLIRYDNMPYIDEEGNLVELKKPTYISKIGDGKTSLSELQPTNNIIPGNAGEGSLVQVIDYEIDEPYIDPNTKEIKFPRSTVTGKASVAFGRYNNVYGRESMAINYANTIKGKWSFVAGQDNVVEENGQSIIIAGGSGNTADGDQGAVFGVGNKINAKHFVVLGTGNELQEGSDWAALLGRGLVSGTSKPQVIIGTYNEEDTAASVIIGSGKQIDGGNGTTVIERRNSIVINPDGKIKMKGDLNINGKTEVTGNVVVSSELNANSAKLTRLAVGTNSTITGAYSAAFGTGSTVSGNYSAVFGTGNKATEYFSFAFGEANTVNGTSSMAVGHNNSIARKGCFVSGKDSSAAALYNTVGGLGLKATSNYQAAFGKYNDTTDENNLFVVGNGSSDEDRKNAFTVNKDNSITVGSTKITEEQLQKLLALLS